MSNQAEAKRFARWATSGLVGAFVTAAGLANIAHGQTWFLPLLGSVQIAGGIGLFVSQAIRQAA